MLNFISIVIILYFLPLTQAMQNLAGPSYTNQPPVNTPQYEPLQSGSKLFCPAGEKEQEALRKFLPDNKNIQLTLIEASSPDSNQETRCMDEVRPIFNFRSDEMKKMEPWDVDTIYDMYVFYFQLWYHFLSPSEYYDFAKNNNPLPNVELIISPVYDIIHDRFMARVILTRHKISSLQNISDYQTLQNQLATAINELSTKPYHFDKDYFLRIIGAFQSHNSQPSNPKMIKQKLVPEQDLAPVRNKAAKHFINIAPLWTKFALLMAVINSAIQRADMRIKISSSTKESSNIHELIIYTRLFYPKKTLQEKFINKLEIPDVWCKFVHYRAEKSAILIYLHNTPHKPPQEADKYCKIDRRVDCNFNNWIENNYQGIENVEYAYCCAPSPSLIKKYFWIQDEFKSVLNIEKIITKSNTDILDESMKKRKSDDLSMEKDEERKKQILINLLEDD